MEAGAKARTFLADQGLLGRATVHDLPDVPVPNGIAVAGGWVIVCCHDGTIVCYRP